MTRTTIKTLDLFSGAGGMSLGFQNAGFRPLAAFEVDEDAAETYEANLQDSAVQCRDIREISFKKYKGAVDVLIGGPPCQPFSRAGFQNSFLDPRDMLPEFLRAVSEVKPKSFVLENVPGLISPRHFSYLTKFMTEFSRLGYFVESSVLNAAEYGVPQDRKRLFVVGSLNLPYVFPKPLNGPRGPRPFLSSLEAILAARCDEPNSSAVIYAKKPVIRPNAYAGMLVNGAGRPINLCGPAPTITASSGGNRTAIVDTSGVLLRYHSYLLAGGTPKQGRVPNVRRLTVREAAALQVFPSDFEFYGSKSSKYRQIGNAVPPKLAEVVACEVLKGI